MVVGKYKMNKKKVSKYYVFTPADVCSGGPEALHQLAYYMRLCGYETYTVYYNQDGIIIKEPIDRYKQYQPIVVSEQCIEDVASNYCIAPENAPWCLNLIHHAKKCIWWLSLHANNVEEGDIKCKLAYLKRRVLGKSILGTRKVLFNPANCIHLCASKYTYQYVSCKYPKSRVEYLVEPISKDFLDIGICVDKSKRQDIVLYNPAKPSDRMSSLLSHSKFKYIPLCGMTPVELADKYKQSMLYVDFGIFGGPERMPKEAVYFGCNILVANHAAAANNFDVAIPPEYKVNDDEPVENTEKRIEYMLNNYAVIFNDFDAFRVKIEGLESAFMSDIKRIFPVDAREAQWWWNKTQWLYKGYRWLKRIYKY